MLHSRWLGPLIIAAAAVFGLAVYGGLPERVPSHWNIDGQVDRTMGRLEAVLLLPGLMLGLWLLISILPRIDPRRASYSLFSDTYQRLMLMLLLFFALLHVATLGVAMGWDVSAPRLITVGAGLLLALIGNELGRVRPNFFFGMRTPWTLASPEVWRQTHRVGGRVTFGVGLLIALAGALLPIQLAAYVVLVGVLGITVFSMGYSYMLWRRATSS